MLLNIPCVIFAGGKSSRMGEDKALLPFGGFSTLCEYQYHKASAIFTQVYISTREPSKFNFSADFIQDSKLYNVFAPTVAFVSIFQALQEESFFALSVDTPFLTQEAIQKIYLQDKKSYDASIATIDEGIQPLCGIYHRSLNEKFLKMLQEDKHKLIHLLKKSNTHYVHFLNKADFLNLNHPHQYQEALKIISNY